MLVKYKEASFVKDRDQYFLEKVKGKSVLHIGACNSPETQMQIDNKLLLHSKLSEQSKDCLGIDICRESIEIMKKNNITNVIFCDIENIESLDKKFDIVIMGEVIEHLNNVGLALENIQKVLNKNGELLISTPNLFSFYWLVGNIKNYEAFNSDHRVGYSMGLLQNMLEKNNFRIIDKNFGFLPRQKWPLWRKFFFQVGKLKPSFAESLIFSASPATQKHQ